METGWERAHRRVAACEVRLAVDQTTVPTTDAPDLTGLAGDRETDWGAPGTTMRTRQRLVRALITDIVADVDRPRARSCS